MRPVRLFLLLACLALPTACVVNPVPTPGNESTLGGGSPDVTGGKGKDTAGGLDVAGQATTDAGPPGADAERNDDFQALPIDPSATDAGVTVALDPHLAWAPAAVATGKLVVVLAGTGGKPAGLQLFQREAARLGHHVLGLSYPNDQAVGVICGLDAGCYESVRHEMFDGVDRTPKIAIAPADSIENRLIKALQDLEKKAPELGFAQFLQGGKPVWGKLIVAGHSQGAGHAAFIARLHEVARVAMVAGVVDTGKDGPAAWVTTSHATPVERYAGFAHMQDPLYPQIQACWTALGLGTKDEAVDVAAALAGPWGNAKQLVSSLDHGGPHVAVIVDAVTPLDAKGVPVYAAVWRHLLGL